MRFDGRVAIVTGGGQGLGREYALQLAARGAAVCVNDLGSALDGRDRSSGPAESVADHIRRAGGRAIANLSDISTPDGCATVVEDAVRAFGRVDILINNAGIKRVSLLQDTSWEDFQAMIGVHLGGAFLMIKNAWPHMMAAGYGRIVNTTSSSVFGLAASPHYVAAKSGVFGLTRALAVEGEKLGIKVNAIAPAAATRMMRSAEGASAAIPDWLLDALEPPLAAKAGVFLAHEDCALNGAVLGAGGGQVTRWMVGESWGIVDPDLTIESIRDRLSEIDDLATFQVYESSADQFRRTVAHFPRKAKPPG